MDFHIINFNFLQKNCIKKNICDLSIINELVNNSLIVYSTKLILTNRPIQSSNTHSCATRESLFHGQKRNSSDKRLDPIEKPI